MVLALVAGKVPFWVSDMEPLMVAGVVDIGEEGREGKPPGWVDAT